MKAALWTLALAASCSGCRNLPSDGPTGKVERMTIQEAYGNLRFPMSAYGGEEPRPSWWLCRPEEIAEICEGVRRGETKVIARTAAGFPVYAVFYGDFADAPRQSNWSAAGSSGSYRSYYGEPEKQTIVWATGFHGAEPEGVVATLNMIRMIEAGRDLRGRSYPRILELLDRYRIVFLPCVNMDGRAISPDHLKGTDKTTFRKVCQGEWPDGRPIEWRESKEHFPLPLDRVKHPGGYPNADGYNIMHDAAPGNIRTAEARAVLGLIERHGADFFFNGHSCESAPFMIMPSEVNYQVLVRRGMDLCDEINGRFAAAGLREGTPKRAASRTVNFNTLVSLTSGGLALTLECNSWAESFDDMVEPCFLALEAVLEDGLRAPLADRPAILRGLP